MLLSIGRDFRLALRALAHRPLYTLIAIATLGIGVFDRQRRREIGIHMALGARRGPVVRRVVGQMLRLIGIVLGLAGAIFASQALGTLLFNTSPLGPVTYISLAAALASVAAVASFLPARSASRLDPVTVLCVE